MTVPPSSSPGALGVGAGLKNWDGELEGRVSVGPAGVVGEGFPAHPATRMDRASQKTQNLTDGDVSRRGFRLPTGSLLSSRGNTPHRFCQLFSPLGTGYPFIHHQIVIRIDSQLVHHGSDLPTRTSRARPRPNITVGDCIQLDFGQGFARGKRCGGRI